MQTQDTAPSLSRSQRARLWLRDARARAINLLTLAVTALVLAIATIGGAVAPANAQVLVEDSAGTVVAAYTPSMAERAAIGLTTMGQGSGTPLACNPDDPAGGCYEPPAAESMCTRIAIWGTTDKGTLPVHRWTDATSNLHSRLGAKFTDDVYQKLARNGLAQSYMSMGNAAWSTSVTMTEAANQFCVGDSIGTTVDKAMGNIARAIFFDAWVGVAVLVFAVAGILFRTARSGMPSLGALGRLLAVTGLVVAMMNGAMNTTTGAGASYGTMSPGWMMNKVNSVLATTSGALSKGLLDGMDGVGEGDTPTPGQQYADQYNSHCYNYMDQLVDHYEQRHVMASVVGMTAAPLALNSIWTESALQSYIGSQFGTGNSYGQASFCHQLEFNAQTSPVEHAYYTQAALADAAVPSPEGQAEKIVLLAADTNGLAYADVMNPRDNIEEDRVMSFWASCVSTNGSSWGAAPGWEDVKDGDINAESCTEAYESTQDDYDWGGGAFNWKNRDHILDDTSATAAKPSGYSNPGNTFHPRQFLENYQGWVATDGMIAAIIHAITSVILLVLFGAISLFIFIAKMALIVLAATVVLVGIADMAFGRTSSRLLKFFKLLLGMAIITWTASFFLSFLAVLTKVINDMGKAMNLNLIGAIVWAGLAPVLAVLLLKFVFSKVLKVPDPLSFQGAKNYMGSAGMIGGTAMDRAIQAPSTMGRGAWDRLTGARNPALAGAGNFNTGAGAARGSLGAHSAGRGRADAMVPDMPDTERVPVGAGVGAAVGAGAGAAVLARRGRGNQPAHAGGYGDFAELDLEQSAYELAREEQQSAGGRGRGAKTEYGQDGAGLPAGVAGAWGRVGAGRNVQRARMVREGQVMEREEIGGRDESSSELSALERNANRLRNTHQVRKVEKQMDRQALAAQRQEMGLVGRNVDRASSAAGKVLRGATSGRATVATLGAGAAAAVAGVGAAPLLMMAGMGMGAVALARHRNARKSGVHAARRAARNQRALATFVDQRTKQMEREDRDSAAVAVGGDEGGGATAWSPSDEEAAMDRRRRSQRRPVPVQDDDDYAPVGDWAEGDSAVEPSNPASGDGGGRAPSMVDDEGDAAWGVSSDDGPAATQLDGRGGGDVGDTEGAGQAPVAPPEDRHDAMGDQPTEALGADAPAPAPQGDETSGPGSGQEGGDAPSAPGPEDDLASKTTARRDIWDGDGRPDHLVQAERDVFDHDGVDDRVAGHRRDVLSGHGRNPEMVAAERDVFDHDGQIDAAVEARKDVFDHDGQPETVTEEFYDGDHDQRPAQ